MPPSSSETKELAPVSAESCSRWGWASREMSQEAGDGTAAFKEADAEAVAAVGALLDHGVLPQGGEQGVGRAFGRPAAAESSCSERGERRESRISKSPSAFPTGADSPMNFHLQSSPFFF